mgnify:CR=1 FL=1
MDKTGRLRFIKAINKEGDIWRCLFTDGEGREYVMWVKIDILFYLPCTLLDKETIKYFKDKDALKEI